MIYPQPYTTPPETFFPRHILDGKKNGSGGAANTVPTLETTACSGGSMSESASRRISPADQDSLLATQAWEVHAALLKAECGDPTLKHNPRWAILRQDAFERFSIAFWGGE